MLCTSGEAKNKRLEQRDVDEFTRGETVLSVARLFILVVALDVEHALPDEALLGQVGADTGSLA